MEQKRAREQPERYTGEDTVRGPREERLGSTVRFWHVLGAALGFSFARPAREKKGTKESSSAVILIALQTSFRVAITCNRNIETEAARAC